MNVRSTIGLLCLLTLLGGCTQILTATNDEPIEDDPGTRSIGSYIDDEIIETKIGVNLKKTSAELGAARVDATSHNGIVLLTGQVANEGLKQQAEQVASAVKKVRKVHNELAVGDAIGALARSNDAWIGTLVKSRLSLDSQLDASRIKVVTENGVVYLMGLLSQPESDLAAKITSETKGVQKVVRVFEYH